VTEIPEHLLRRSRERREALGLAKPGEAAPPAPAAEASAVEPAEAASPAAAAPAVPAPAPAPAPAPPPPPKPDPPYIAAAKRRRRIPVWALPVLVALPVWGFVYATTLETPTSPNDPLTVGREVYGQCASCHGASGGGGVGPALTEGDTLLTFPDFRDHLIWVRDGTEAANPDGTYGDPDREGGARTLDDFSGTMPAFGGSLSEEELIAVVRFEREVLSGADPAEEPDLVAASEGEMTLDELLAGSDEGASGG
jgi:mono/diheme cytochrome c family protein